MLSDLLRRVACVLEPPDAETIHRRLDEIKDTLRNLERRASRAPRLSTSRRAARPAGPPYTSSYLLYLFLGRADRQTIPGDLEEEFTLIMLPRFGARRARLWHWSQTVRIIAYRNLLCRWLLVGGGIYKISEWITHKIGS